MIWRVHFRVGLAVLACAVRAVAGPYSGALNDPANIYDAPIPGFVGPDGIGGARLLQSGGTYQNPNNYVNPLFYDWAATITSYSPAAGVASAWSDPTKALGKVTGDILDIVSLGDLSASQISGGTAPGTVTLHFSHPISNLTGADFAVFENGFAASVSSPIFADLGYVEVSSNGVNFARFPSQSLTAAAVGAYGTITASNVFNLAGKTANGYGVSWGTPFDLAQLLGDPLVVGGLLDLNAVTTVRIVDIPGNGSFLDSAGRPIFDAWMTIGSGGFDLDAVGVVSRKTTFPEWCQSYGMALSETDDPDGDGVANLLEYAFGTVPTRMETTDPRPTAVLAAGVLQISFLRDERAADLTYEVQVSSDLQTWVPLAQSVGGQPVAALPGHTPQIEESNASDILSVGVIRRVLVRDETSGAKACFMRLKIMR